MSTLHNFSYASSHILESGSKFIFPKNRNKNVYEFVELVEHVKSPDYVIKIVVCYSIYTHNYTAFELSPFESREIELVLI